MSRAIKKYKRIAIKIIRITLIILSPLIYLIYLLINLIIHIIKYFLNLEIRWKLISIKSLVLLLVVFVSYIFVLIYINIYSDIPITTNISDQRSPQTTKLYDRNINLLYEIYKDQNRELVSIDQVPKDVINATLAIEDQDFYSHKGISIYGIIRAIKKTLLEDNIQGGSTITQQLVKNKLLNNEISLDRKIKEIFLALKIEGLYSKDRILEMYFNEINYGGPSYGIKSAARMYFNKDLKDLNLAEITMLVGLPASPSLYSPLISDPKLSKKRQREVLDQMVKLGYLTKEKADEVYSTELVYALQKTSIKYPHFVNYVRSYLEEHFGRELVETGGLIVVTSIDSALQDKSEQIVKEDVYKMRVNNVKNGAVLVTNPATGEVLAMVGSKDFWDKSIDGNVNITTSERQPGSSIKPINYSLAFELGYSPYSKILDAPVIFKQVIPPDFIPKNYDNAFHGVMTLKHALANSYNVPAVKLLNEIGLDNFINHAHKMGITTFTDRSRYGLSLTLGAGEVKMVDMNVVYGVFPNLGEKIELNPILKIYSSKGDLLYENPCANVDNLALELLDLKNAGTNVVLGSQTKSCNRERVISELSSYYINDILSDNKERSTAFGYSSNLDIKSKQVAVKTGTTTNLRDNWAIGYTNDYVVSSWIGNNHNEKMTNVASGYQSASLIWRHVFDYLISERDIKAKLNTPTNLVEVNVCPLTDTLACNGCTNVKRLVNKDSMPRECDYNLYNKLLYELKEKDKKKDEKKHNSEQAAGL